MAPWPLEQCPCGSGHDREPNYDGHGCFLFYSCDVCYRRKIAKYRPDIFERYECDEQIEADY